MSFNQQVMANKIRLPKNVNINPTVRIKFWDNKPDNLNLYIAQHFVCDSLPSWPFLMLYSADLIGMEPKRTVAYGLYTKTYSYDFIKAITISKKRSNELM